MQKNKGFTLIELMIAVAIVGILAAIAIPNYQESVRKSRRVDAQGALLSFANAMERYFTINNNYCDIGTTGTGAASVCGGTANDTGIPPSTLFPSKSPVDGGTKYYNLTIDAMSTNGNTYTLRAIPINTAATGDSTAQNGNGMLELDSTGVRGWDKNNNGTIESSEKTWEN